jgi:hypothetical protein
VILPAGTSTWLSKAGPDHIDGFDFLTSYAKVAVYISEHADLMTDTECNLKSHNDKTIDCDDVLTINDCLYTSTTDEECGDPAEARAEVEKIANFANNYAEAFNQLDSSVSANIVFLQSSGIDTAGPLIDEAIKRNCFETCIDKYVSELGTHPWHKSVLLEHKILGVPLMKVTTAGAVEPARVRSASRFKFEFIRDHYGHAHVKLNEGLNRP